MKVTVGVDVNETLIQSLDAFRPDVKLALVRHPAHVLSELHDVSKAERATVLKRMEVVWQTRNEWDAVLILEDVIFNPSVTRQKLLAAGFSEEHLEAMVCDPSSVIHPSSFPS